MLRDRGERGNRVKINRGGERSFASHLGVLKTIAALPSLMGLSRNDAKRRFQASDRRERKTKRAAFSKPVGSRLNVLRNYWTNRINGKFVSHNPNAPKYISFATLP